MEKISKEKVIEIINWAEYQGHIRGDIDVLRENIWNEDDDEEKSHN